jgi:hypothetical protein
MTSDTHAAGPERTSGKSFDCSRRGAAVAEGRFETADRLQQGTAVRPVGHPTAGSSLVRRLVLAKDDPAKQLIRAWLSAIDDDRIFCLGLTSEDIAVLRGMASPPAEATVAPRLDATVEAAAGYTFEAHSPGAASESYYASRRLPLSHSMARG